MVVLILRQMSETFSWLVIFVAALSAVNALNKLFELGFHGIWLDMLAYYNNLTQPFRDLIFKIFPSIYIPAWLPDVLILYFILVGAGIRATLWPLKNDDYYSSNNLKKMKVFKIPKIRSEDEMDDPVSFWAEKYNFHKDNFMYAIGDGVCLEIHLKEVKPRWQLYVTTFLCCLTLYPVVTLEPYRKMRIAPSKLFSLLKDVRPEKGTVEEFSDDGKIIYTVHGLKFQRAQFHRAFQIVLLPIFVVIFVFCGTYLP